MKRMPDLRERLAAYAVLLIAFCAVLYGALVYFACKAPIDEQSAALGCKALLLGG